MTRWLAGASALVPVLFVAALAVPSSAGTRDDLARLDQQTQALSTQVQQLSVQMAQIQKSVQALSSRIDGIERSAQTADLRADLDTLKRQNEMLSSQIESLRIAREVTPPPPQSPPGPFQVPPLKGAAIAAPPKVPSVKAPLLPTPAPVSPDLYNQAYSDYVQGKFDLAASEFRQFMEAYPSDPKAGNSRYWIGECAYSQKRYEEAKEAFQAVLAEYPLGGKSLAARLKLGLTLVAMDQVAKGITELKDLVQSAPNSDEALIAKDRLSKLQGP